MLIFPIRFKTEYKVRGYFSKSAEGQMAHVTSLRRESTAIEPQGNVSQSMLASYVTYREGRL